VPDQANTYLLCGYGDVPPPALQVMRRSTLVLAASTVVLLISLTFLYVPQVRRPSVLVVAAVATAGLGFAYPELVPAAIESAAFGALLAMASLLIERNVARRRGRATRGMVEAASAHRGSTKTRLVPSGAVPPPSTAAIEIGSPSLGSGGAG
jgi:hypothetical protein